MSYFKAKMHQIQFRLGGAYSAPPDPLVECKGTTSMEREGKGREGKGRNPWFLPTPPDMKSWIKACYYQQCCR